MPTAAIFIIILNVNAAIQNKKLKLLKELFDLKNLNYLQQIIFTSNFQKWKTLVWPAISSIGIFRCHHLKIIIPNADILLEWTT